MYFPFNKLIYIWYLYIHHGLCYFHFHLFLIHRPGEKKESIIIYGYSMLRGIHSYQDLKINLFFLKLYCFIRFFFPPFYGSLFSCKRIGQLLWSSWIWQILVYTLSDLISVMLKSFSMVVFRYFTFYWFPDL